MLFISYPQLRKCANHPAQAKAVLEQTPAPNLAIRTVPIQVVLDTEINAHQLLEVGVMMNDFMAVKVPLPTLTQLGYSLDLLK